MNQKIIWGIATVAFWVAGVLIEDTLNLCAPANASFGRKAGIWAALAIGATWPYLVFEFWKNRTGTAGKLRKPIESIIRSDLAIPQQIEAVFVQSVKVEVDRMLRLANQEPVTHVNLDTQYNYASGIAAHYEAHPVDTIGATALDVPSVFFGNHSDYFTFQQSLVIPSEEFVAFSRHEAINLEVLIKGKDVGPWRQPGKMPAKGRIVVIAQQKLVEEVDQDDFWEFVYWHVRFQFGLKFFVRELSPQPYEDLLAGAVNPNKDKTIDDFIVYGEDCVFGRVNPNPVEKQVKLNFHYAMQPSRERGIDTVRKYRRFFTWLWTDDEPPRTHTLTEAAAELPQLRQKLGARTTELQKLKELYDAVKLAQRA